MSVDDKDAVIAALHEALGESARLLGTIPTKDQRVHELENALRDAVRFLHSLPLSPVMLTAIRQAKTALDATPAQAAPTPFRPPMFGEMLTPAGILMASVLVENDMATVRCDVPEFKADALRAYLQEGITVKLTRKN